MRYPDGGGLTARQRMAREQVRLGAVRLFEQDADPVRIARELRVSTKSVYAWRRAWRSGGAAALASRGAGGLRCRLGPAQLARLEAGPAVHGWADQRWTLERVAVLIGRLFTVAYTPRGCRTCCTGWGIPRSGRCTGPLSVTRARSPRGGR